MTTTDASAAMEPASAARLLRSTLIALLVAITLLVIAVLPAEYGVDPTGIGRVLGLTEMGEIKVALAREAAAGVPAVEAGPAAATVATPAPTAGAALPDSTWRDVTEVTLEANQGKEVKLVMTKGSRAQYEWTASGGVVNFDMHGDSTNLPNSYVRYERGTGASAQSGDLVAAMDGAHGWFWRNRSTATVTVTLRTRGEYGELRKMY